MTTPAKYRYCIGCIFLWIDLGEENWSEMTPGCPGDVHCEKGHFKIDKKKVQQSIESEESLIYSAMLKARTCDDYEERAA